MTTYINCIVASMLEKWTGSAVTGSRTLANDFFMQARINSNDIHIFMTFKRLVI